MGLLMKIRAIIGKITDILLAGREAGLWDKKDEPWKSDRKDDFKEGK
jgi:hypothetical protein